MKPKNYRLTNVDELAKTYKYTYYKPSEKLIESIEIDDEVKLTFEFEFEYDEELHSHPASERMWVKVNRIEKEYFLGVLSNNPQYENSLKLGDEIRFEAKNISDIYNKYEESIVDEYQDRCITTVRILNGEDKIAYIYAEEPRRLENDMINSGWTFLAGNETDEYLNEADNLRMVSLGAVLNRDDSFVHLLKIENIGKSFERDENGVFQQISMAEYEHETLGVFIYDEDRQSWAKKIELLSFQQFSFKENGGLYSLLLQQDEVNELPAKKMETLALKIIQNQETLVEKIINILWQDFHGEGANSGMWWHNEGFENVFEETHDVPKYPNDLKEYLTLYEIFIEDGMAELHFEAEFEEEHGLAILTDGENILGTGYCSDVSVFREIR